jgi:surfactin synthase thioesterase subunit
VLADAGLRAMVLAILRNDLHLYEGYCWGTRGTIAAPIVAMRGADDTSVTAASMRAWASSTRSSHFEYIEVPGRHLPTRQAALVWPAWVDSVGIR